MQTNETTHSPFEVARKRLWDEMVNLQNTWDEYTYLFLESQERIDLLNRSARWMFGLMQRLMMREIIMGASRVTDPAESKQQRNLTLELLLTDQRIDEHAGLREELKRRIADLREEAAPIRKHRHKHLAHLDHAVAVGEANAALPPLSRTLLRDVLHEMQAIYNKHGETVRDSSASFTLQPLGDSARLVRVLEDAAKWEEGEIERRRQLRG